MKRWLAYIIPLLLCACQGNSIRQELHRVDSLNQCDVPLDTITTMDEVVEYLDWWGTPNERMAAHYLQGRVFHDQNNAPMALRCYRDAVGYADTTADNCDYRRLSRIYGQIADLFHQQRAPRLEIEAEQKAIQNAWIAKDTLAAVIFYGSLCDPYHMLNDMDSVILVIENLNDICKRIGMEHVAATYNLTLADVHLRKKDYEKAKKALNEYELHSGFFDEKGNIERGREIYYKFKGLYYDATGQKDSAEYCYRKILHSNNGNDNATAAYHGLLSIYNHIANSDSIAKYANLYCQYNDSASFQHSADELTRVHALYNYEEHERIAAKKTIEAERYKQAAIILIVILSITGYTTYRYFRRQKQKQRNELRIANTAYSDLLSQYHQVNTDLENSRLSLENYHKEKEHELDILKERLAEYQVEATVVERWTSEQTMLHSTIVNQLHQLASQVVVPTNAQWQEFCKFAEEYLTDFYQHINRRDLELTDQEILVCILTRLQFIPTEQAALLDVSKQRITNLRSSINQKLFDEKSSKTLEKNILNLCS